MQNPPAQNFPPVFLWEGMCLLRLFNMQVRGTGKMDCVPPADSAIPSQKCQPYTSGSFFFRKIFYFIYNKQQQS